VCERGGDFRDKFNGCKKNDGMSWQGAWDSTMKHDNVLNLSLVDVNLAGTQEENLVYIFGVFFKDSKVGY
jgi:hypothetical protein